jgi:hypothetical protein
MLKKLISFHFKISFFFLILALFFGLLYSLNLLGYFSSVFPPQNARSLHISLMLYGFAPLMMSMLPFALFDKDTLNDDDANRYLNIYFIIWYIFLIFMIFSLMLGNLRGLPFYDFPYALNFILALSGLFYIIAIFKYIKHYAIKPLWVKVSLWVVIISPFLLILLMNPQYGQVEKMLQGPHGDNTLGMSFVLLVLYYLVIKLSCQTSFRPRFNILWIIPLFFYLGSVLHRIFLGSLSYNQEWFLQWLTFLYIPMLFIWFKDAKLKWSDNYFLSISIAAFMFVTVEGNIIFIPQIRHLFHRNDLVVGHAHIAVGISFLFMAFAIVKKYIDFPKKIIFLWTFSLVLMALALSINGFYQAGFITVDSSLMWMLRSLFGSVVFISALYYFLNLFNIKHINFHNRLQLYHLGGFLSDGLGGLLLLFFGSTIYSLLGFHFSYGYLLVVFAFMMSIGLMHLIGLIKQSYDIALLTALTRIMISAIFFSLYIAHYLGLVALLISLYDLSYALIFIVGIYAIQKRI